MIGSEAGRFLTSYDPYWWRLLSCNIKNCSFYCPQNGSKLTFLNCQSYADVIVTSTVAKDGLAV